MDNATTIPRIDSTCLIKQTAGEMIFTHRKREKVLVRLYIGSLRQYRSDVID